MFLPIDSELADAEFKKELKVLMAFRPHPNIIQLLGVCTKQGKYPAGNFDVDLTSNGCRHLSKKR